MIILPHNRSHDFFNIDDKIACYLTFEKDHELYNKGDEGWFLGEVRLGYRHHDGCVSYRLNGVGPQDPERDKNGTPLDDDFKGYWGSGYSQPGVMKLEEFLYFKDHTDEYIEWFEMSKEHSYGSEWYFHPINKEDIARFAMYMLAHESS